MAMVAQLRSSLISTGKLALKVVPRARVEGIEGLDEAGELVVKVRAAAEDGKANAAVIALLAAELSIPKGKLQIARGATSRHKVLAYTE
jgi:uncharacterized protein YggU (UPF0235/DUF167 family)